VAQVDDDVIVNVDALATYLRERRTQGNLYMVCKNFAPEHMTHAAPKCSGMGTESLTMILQCAEAAHPIRLCFS